MPSEDRQDIPNFAAAFWPGYAQMLQIQHQQWLALLAWQQSMLAMQQDLLDQWVSRWADGARLDD